VIEYFFFIDTNPKSPTYKKPMSVHRLRIDKSGAYTERWNGEEWEENNNLIAFSGIGGDTDYYKTTEAEAMGFLSSHTNEKKSWKGLY
jgi:hypothetical protein